ncbi:cytochrome P450 [Nocardia fusca]|uniref:cytochrome P450 n=1 Tax=Nocardia fusca TaxID=941183 RepID=UPI0037A8A55B
MTASPAERRCPVEDYVYKRPPVPALTLFHDMDERRARSCPGFWSEEGSGYWVFTDHDVILDGLQHADLWSSSIITPLDRDPTYQLIPVMTDPPEHAHWRHLLADWFSPKRVREMRTEQERFAEELIGAVSGKGESDFLRDVAQRFPAGVFLNIMGMPTEMLDEFLGWEHEILHVDSASDPDGSRAVAAQTKVVQYFGGLIAQRRAEPNPDAKDLVSAAVNWQIEGKPVADADILNCMLTLFMAGLDTVASQLAYSVLHLATHPEDRARLVREPELVPHAVEELMRAYPILQTARKATRDADFHGCDIKAGDVAAFPLPSAGRDDSYYPDAARVDFDREIVRHLSFGAGPHRCLGSHLARQELAVVLTEWNRQVPEFELAGEPLEHGGSAWGLDSLPLRWHAR